MSFDKVDLSLSICESLIYFFLSLYEDESLPILYNLKWKEMHKKEEIRDKSRMKDLKRLPRLDKLGTLPYL